MRRALLIGINDYPRKDDILDACVNDVNDFSDLLKSKYKFKSSEINVIKNRKATRKNILKGLEWLAGKTKKGDKLLFVYSGHGFQLPTLNRQHEVDGLDECICPVDSNWEGKNMIRDKEFNSVFSLIPKGASLTWVSDSCHSQGLTKAISGKKYFKKKRMTASPWIQDLQQKAFEKGIKPAGFGKSLRRLNAILLAGCKSGMESGEGEFGMNNRPNGILIYYLLQELKSKDGSKKTLNELIRRIRISAKKYLEKEDGDFIQEPQIEGSMVMRKKAFLG